MFLGEYVHTLDKEFRVALPARLREAAGKALKDGLCLLCGAEPCIIACTPQRLEQLLAPLATDPSIGKTALRDFKRALGSSASTVVPDSQGRVRLPEFLRAHARIEKDVTIVGVVDAIEIWSTPVFRGRESARRATYGQLASRIYG